jgi:hypothetical protein
MTGREGVWRVPLASGTPERILDALAEKAAVSPDGKLLAYSYMTERLSSTSWRLPR